MLAGKLTRAQLSTDYAAKLRRTKKAKPLAETTVAHHHAMFKTAYNWALEEELLIVNPALRVKNPPALRPKTRPVWSMGEIASTVIKARGLQVHAAGVLAGFSGLRVGEIAGLIWSDLDLERGFVTVSRSIEEDDDGTLLEYPAKNGKARTVPLPAAACDELRVWLAAQKEYCLAQGPAWNEAGRVVPKKDGTQMAPSTLKSQWWNWVARQKIDPHLPIHGLRDSFGTWVYETYGVKQAQEWLGHSDPATTLRHYVRLTTAARAKAVAGLDEATRAAVERAEEKVLEDAQPLEDNVVALASRRQQLSAPLDHLLRLRRPASRRMPGAALERLAQPPGGSPASRRSWCFVPRFCTTSETTVIRWSSPKTASTIATILPTFNAEVRSSKPTVVMVTKLK